MDLGDARLVVVFSVLALSCSSAGTSGGTSPDAGRNAENAGSSDAGSSGGVGGGASSGGAGSGDAGSSDASSSGASRGDADSGDAASRDASSGGGNGEVGSDGGLTGGGGHVSGAGDGGGPAAGSLDAGGGTGGGTRGSGAIAGGLLVFPAPNAQGLCADPPLRITFSGPPTLGTNGKIQVFDAAQPGSAVASLDMAATSFSDTIGGTTFNTVRPAYVDGNDAVFYLASHALAFGHTYFVTVDAGAVAGPGGAQVSITGATTWRFTTAAAAPSAGASLSVALDGSSPFCSVQGALDAIPANNDSAVTVTIARGTYHEIVHFTSKNNVTLLGQDRSATIIAGTNNNDLNPSTATRSLVGVDRSTGLVVDTLTIHNLTPQGGSQAEALRLESCDRCVVRNADILSLQDTLLWSGRVYAKNCLIAGNVDFVWGTGAAYFDQCELRAVGRAGWNVQARNPASTFGYVFVDSKLTSDPASLTGQGLARIDVSVYPASHVAYVDCQMGPHISPAGWTVTGGTDLSQLRFWEYRSVDPSGNAIDVSRRLAGSTQISAAQAAQMRDPTVVLAGWQPPP